MFSKTLKPKKPKNLSPKIYVFFQPWICGMHRRYMIIVMLSTAGPTVWNSLPDELRNSDSFDSFKRFMKTILFSRY